MKILFNGAECVNCGQQIAVGTEAEVHPTKRGPRGGKKLVHAQCADPMAKKNGRARRNMSKQPAVYMRQYPPHSMAWFTRQYHALLTRFSETMVEGTQTPENLILAEKLDELYDHNPDWGDAAEKSWHYTPMAKKNGREKDQALAKQVIAEMRNYGVADGYYGPSLWEYFNDAYDGVYTYGGEPSGLRLADGTEAEKEAVWEKVNAYYKKRAQNNPGGSRSRRSGWDEEVRAKIAKAARAKAKAKKTRPKWMQRGGSRWDSASPEERRRMAQELGRRLRWQDE